MFTLSCSSLPASLLPHKGTNVAANTQVGQNNTQVLGQYNTYATQSVPVAHAVEQSQGQVNRVKADNASVVNYTETNYKWVLFALLGWLLPTPKTMIKDLWSAIRGLFT